MTQKMAYAKSRKVELIDPNTLPQPLQYVWVVEGAICNDTGFRAEKYVLLKKNRGGGVTVLCRGYPKNIPTAQTRKFLTDPEEVEAYMRKQIQTSLDTATNKAKRLADMLKLQRDVLLERQSLFTPPTQRVLPGKLKL